IPRGDAIYAAAMKVFGLMSGRRSMSDLRAYEARGYMTHAPSYSSVFRCLDRADLTPVFRSLVEESAKPMIPIESHFAADSTGFSTCTYGCWFDNKHGDGDARRQ